MGSCWSGSLSDGGLKQFGDESNARECLTVWRHAATVHCARGSALHGCERDLFACERDEHDSLDSTCWLGSMQPYVGSDRYFDSPYVENFGDNGFAIDMGVDPDISTALEPGRTMSAMSRGNGREDEASAKVEAKMQLDMDAIGRELGEHWAPSASSSERLGVPRPAVGGTQMQPQHLTEQCALLGGGKRGAVFTSADIIQAGNVPEQPLTPGHLQDRMVVLQQRAMEAIHALPVDCRDDYGFGKVETRVWGLEALKHVLKMRLALQHSLPLTQLVAQEPTMPPANELLAANLTLTLSNPGNRCYANTVLRMWCWMGAHHSNPKEFWGPSTNLCLQLLQQDVIEDIFWASELQPALARLEQPQQQHDASEFLVHLWELWGQTGLQGTWFSYFGGRDHEFDTIPLYVRMPADAGDDISFEQLLSEWANEANGQCLANEVEHIVFHVGRYSLDAAAKEWVKHHNRLHTPSSFRCPQRTLTGHTGHSTFVLRGIIAHQGAQLTSGHYVAMLVEGDAVWTVDDGECPQPRKQVPEEIQRGAVMIWASRAEHSQFWTHTIGSFAPPPKRPRVSCDGIEVFYSNVTQWNRDACDWLLQQDIQVAMLVETHVAGKQLATVSQALARSRWQLATLEAYETGRGGTSGGHFFCSREGQAAYKIHQCDKAGNGYLANVLQRHNWEVVLVSLYLKCGEDLNSPTNAAVLGDLAAFLRELAIPWLVVGDFQVPPTQWQGHQLLNVLKAEVVCTGQPTLINGAELDYIVASRTLTPFLDVKVNWDVPWRPHAGLVVTIDSSAPRLHLPQVTHYAAVPKLQQATKQWDDITAAPKPYWLGRTLGPKELQCAEWCHQAEQYVLQNLHEPRCGRGWYLALELKPLPLTRPLTPWRKGDLAYWGQFMSLLSHIELKGQLSHNVMLHLKAKAADLDMRWQNVHGDVAFRAALEALISGESMPLSLLMKGAEANRDFAKTAALQQQSQEYQAWLSQATLKGHSGIYKCLKAPDVVHVRPFRNVPVQDRQKLREQQWYAKWQVVDKPVTSGERERLRWEGIVQARQWEDLDPHQVMKKLSNLPQKASGPDGISYALLRNLPLEGVVSLCNMYRQWELTGRLPDQVCTTLVVLLPKKEDIERPISLTSVLYRTWCKLRWDKLKQWQNVVGQRLPWERSMPGMQVLYVALMRLPKCEVGRATGRHVVSLLLDLQCFYDSVDLEQLLGLWEPLNFPPATLNAVYEVYSGPRLLQAEQITSTPVHCSKGILAGCPVAPLIAKLVLGPVIDQFTAEFPRASVDVWVDDISVDFTGMDANVVSREALDGYEQLKTGLEAIGLQLSATKTGFLASTVECKRALSLFRRDHQPQVHELLKDLGLDSSGGRRRRIGAQQKRLLKGRGRQTKLLHLKLRSRPVRIRIWKTSVHAAAGYGLEAQGIAPQRLRTLRQQLARHGGLQKGGSVDIVFDQHHKLQDPKDTIVERQLKAMHQLVQAWPVNQQGELRTAWRVSWRRLRAAAYPWMVVAGPMAALQAYLMDMGWDAEDLDDWLRAPTGIMPPQQMCIGHPWEHLQRQLKAEQTMQRARRIQELEHCFPLMRRPDWTIYHRVMRKLKGVARTAVDAWDSRLPPYSHSG